MSPSTDYSLSSDVNFNSSTQQGIQQKNSKDSADIDTFLSSTILSTFNPLLNSSPDGQLEIRFQVQQMVQPPSQALLPVLAGSPFRADTQREATVSMRSAAEMHQQTLQSPLSMGISMDETQKKIAKIVELYRSRYSKVHTTCEQNIRNGMEIICETKKLLTTINPAIDEVEKVLIKIRNFTSQFYQMIHKFKSFRFSIYQGCMELIRRCIYILEIALLLKYDREDLQQIGCIIAMVQRTYNSLPTIIEKFNLDHTIIVKHEKFNLFDHDISTIKDSNADTLIEKFDQYGVGIFNTCDYKKFGDIEDFIIMFLSIPVNSHTSGAKLTSAIKPDFQPMTREQLLTKKQENKERIIDIYRSRSSETNTTCEQNIRNGMEIICEAEILLTTTNPATDKAEEVLEKISNFTIKFYSQTRSFNYYKFSAYKLCMELMRLCLYVIKTALLLKYHHKNLRQIGNVISRLHTSYKSLPTIIEKLNIDHTIFVNYDKYNLLEDDIHTITNNNSETLIEMFEDDGISIFNICDYEKFGAIAEFMIMLLSLHPKKTPGTKGSESIITSSSPTTSHFGKRPTPEGGFPLETDPEDQFASATQQTNQETSSSNLIPALSSVTQVMQKETLLSEEQDDIWKNEFDAFYPLGLNASYVSSPIPSTGNPMPAGNPAVQVMQKEILLSEEQDDIWKKKFNTLYPQDSDNGSATQQPLFNSTENPSDTISLDDDSTFL
jgi:hypothetical protein